MKISLNDWTRYVERLKAVNEKAAERMQAWIDANGLDNMDALIEYAYSITSRYGEAAAELACEMYDAVALAEGVAVASAVPAEVAVYDEVAKAMLGTSPLEKSTAVYRLVKRTAADTTLKNAERDGAQFAWIPSGDTCSFCITLASRGWQRISKKSYRNGHAEHIHGHCDCQYAIRFSDKSAVQGYDPEEYLRQYRDAGSDVNAMRRMKYASIKDERNARRRELYAMRKEEKNQED